MLDSALEQRRLKSENAYLRAQLEERYRFEGIVGKSRAMARLFQLLETVARDEQHDPDHRRNRHRQGSRRARDSSQQPAARASVRRAQLQRDSRDAARGGAVRPRARRVHRRGRQPPGAARAGAQGHAVPRRSGDDERGAADEAAARAAGARVRARRRLAHDQGGRARHRRDQQRPREDGRRRAVPRGPVLPAERDPGAAAAAARAARKTSRCSCSTSSRSSAREQRAAARSS